MTDTTYCAALGPLVERLLVPGEQVDEVCVVETVPWLKIGLVGGLRELVPGAVQLAVVAAVNPVADGFAELLRNGAVEFDGQVGDTAAGVEQVGRDDGMGRADVEAGPAAAAVAARRPVDRQRQVGIQLAEEKPGTVPSIDQVGVFSDPAESRLFGDRFFQHRGAVDEDAIAEGTCRGLDASGEGAQPAAQQLVVIATQRVTRNVGF